MNARNSARLEMVMFCGLGFFAIEIWKAFWASVPRWSMTVTTTQTSPCTRGTPERVAPEKESQSGWVTSHV